MRSYIFTGELVSAFGDVFRHTNTILYTYITRRMRVRPLRHMP